MLPLAQRRILVTRARGQASALAELLAAQGATAVLVPTIEIAPPESWCALDAALSCLRSFDWLIFTSANAVQAFVERARNLRLAAHPRRIAAIGPATARAVVATGLAPAVDLMPPQFVAEALAAALEPHCAGASMLLVRAAAARDVLPELLARAGAAVTIANAYCSLVPRESIAALPRLLARDGAGIDAITFTSASTARNLATLLETAGVALPGQVVLASIGPITSAEMRALGMSPTVEARESTIAALVAALTEHFQISR